MSARFRRLRRLGYRRARLLLLVVGVAVLLVVALVTYIRRVETIEVTATLLFIPIFVALVLWKIPGGLIAGLLATGVYALLRLPAIELVGLGPFLGLIVSRAVAFLLFGLLGGWAARELETTIRKIDLYDQIDDATGLFNARFFVEDTDMEMSRSERYRTIFSVCVVDVPARVLDALPRRKAGRALAQLGRVVRAAIRTVDRAVHARSDSLLRIAVILPETGQEGAAVFTGRLAEAVSSFLTERGSSFGADEVMGRTVTFPDQEAELRTLREDFAAIDRAEHPEAPAAGTSRGPAAP
jgi:GGDEF domain-containing protein